MYRKITLAVLLLLSAALVTGYFWRDTAMKFAANIALADMPVEVTDLQGLRFGASGLTVDSIDVLLSTSSQRLTLSALALGYRRDGFFAWPVAETLRLGAVRLEPLASSESIPTVAATDTGADGITPEAVLAFLRDFPLQSIELSEVRLPGWPDVLSMQIVADAGELNIELHSGGTEVSGNFRQPVATAAAQFTFEVRDGSGTSGNLELSLVPGPDPASVTGSGSFMLAGDWQQQPYELTGTLEVPDCAIDDYAACSLDFNGRASLAAYAVNADTTVSGLVFEGTGAISLVDTALQLTLEPGFVLTAAAVQSAAIQLAELMLIGDSALTLQRALTTSELQVEAAVLSGAVGVATVDEWSLATAFELRELNMVSGAELSAALQVATSGMSLSGPPAWLPPFDIDAALALEGEHLSFSTPLRLRAMTGSGETDSGIEVQGSHNLATGTGEAQVTLSELDLTGEGNSLEERLGGWPWDADLLGGSLAGQVDLQWLGADTAVITATASASLQELAGFYGSYYFRGLDAMLTADIDTAAVLPVTTPPLTLTLAELDVGLPVRNLSLSLQLDRQTQSLVVGSLYGELLDGSISASDQRFSFGNADNAMTLQFDGFRLERLLELTGYEGVQASGAVSGEVPLLFSAAGVEVAGGRLFALRPGGTIRYLGAVGNGPGNTQLDIMYNALSNYRFETLESSIDYSPSGELLLSMQLQGSNPDLENGRQVNLNLNLSDNIPALLRSLQAGRALEDFLEAQYR